MSGSWASSWFSLDVNHQLLGIFPGTTEAALVGAKGQRWKQGQGGGVCGERFKLIKEDKSIG